MRSGKGEKHGTVSKSSDFIVLGNPVDAVAVVQKEEVTEAVEVVAEDGGSVVQAHGEAGGPRTV